MTTTPDTFHWRKLNADERAAIAAHLAREGFPGFMFIETHAGEFVPMVMEKIETKLDTTQDTEGH